ncbi:hypothetical protein DFJ74DRAFT_326079 [Hyaloraphidium curvatum]|nr:hypothetical protein DFJ74DRAFT_326079 [Hyaloraphidium curvatum]
MSDRPRERADGAFDELCTELRSRFPDAQHISHLQWESNGTAATPIFVVPDDSAAPRRGKARATGGKSKPRIVSLCPHCREVIGPQAVDEGQMGGNLNRHIKRAACPGRAKVQSVRRRGQRITAARKRAAQAPRAEPRSPAVKAEEDGDDETLSPMSRGEPLGDAEPSDEADQPVDQWSAMAKFEEFEKPSPSEVALKQELFQTTVELHVATLNPDPACQRAAIDALLDHLMVVAHGRTLQDIHALASAVLDATIAQVLGDAPEDFPYEYIDLADGLEA